MTPQQTLINNCLKGDKRSRYQLVELYSGLLLTTCRRYARDEAMAYDMLQETLILIFKNLHKYRPIGPFEGWIRRIAINCSLQWIAKSCYKREQSVIEFYEKETSEPLIFSQLGQEEIIKCIQQLPDGYRTVLNLYIVEGYSHKEISELLNISVGTSRSQLLRAKKSLIVLLEDKPNKIAV